MMLVIVGIVEGLCRCLSTSDTFFALAFEPLVFTYIMIAWL